MLSDIQIENEALDSYAFSVPSCRETERQEISRLTQDFLDAGGEIEEIETGVTGYDYNIQWNQVESKFR